MSSTTPVSSNYTPQQRLRLLDASRTHRVAVR
jgi:hypothetical protein